MELPPKPAATPPRGSFLPLALAGMLGMGLLAGAVLVTSAILGPFVLAAVMVVMGVFLFVAFHYVLWGWWLGKDIRREVEAEDRREP